MANNHIIPSLGHIALHDMLAFHISRYKEIKLQDGQGLRGGRLSPVTVNKHLSLISDVLEDAASPGKRLIPFNPSTMVKRARGGRNRVTAVVNCLNIEQLNDLLGRLSLLYSFRGAPDSVKKKPETIRALKHAGYTDKEINSPKALHKFKAVMLFPIVYLASVTGMRLSELLALRWADVDFLNRTVRVYESSHYGVKRRPEENPHHVNPTKEGRPKALLDLSAKDIEFLRRYREDQEHRRKRYRGRYVDHGLLFAKNNGAHLRNDTVGTEFSSFARSIGLSVTIHGLRHTHCTLLLEAEVPIAFVSRRVGHRLIFTTSDIYAHVDETKGANLSEVFLQILEKNEGAVPGEQHS